MRATAHPLIICLITVMACGLTGCGGDDKISTPIGGKLDVDHAATGGGGGGGGDDDDEGTPGGTPGTSEKTWTFMVYMAADNNLASAGLKDIREMMQVGSNDNVNVIVKAEFGTDYLAYESVNSPADANIPGLPSFETTTYLVKSGSVEPISASINQDMADPATLAGFISQTTADYPADHNVLVLWNHGQNLVGVCQDETDSGYDMMDLHEMRTAIVDGGAHFDIVDIDACLMARLEVAEVLYEHCDYLVASLLTEPGDGDPYTPMLQHLTANPDQTPETYAATICKDFVDSYGTAHGSVTKSALDLSVYPLFRSALDDLAADMEAALLDGYRSEIEAAREATVAIDAEVDRDLGHFIAEVKSHASAALPAALFTSTENALDNMVVANEFRVVGSQPTGLASCTGIGGFLPSSIGDEGLISMDGFEQVMLGSMPNWCSFVRELVGSSMFDVENPPGFGFMLEWSDPNVDIDLYVKEPSLNDAGYLWLSPFMGTVSPHGYLGAGYGWEGWVSKEWVMVGEFEAYVALYDDNSSDSPDIEVTWSTQEAGSWIEQGTVIVNDSQPVNVDIWAGPTPGQENAIDSDLHSDWKYLTSVMVNSG